MPYINITTDGGFVVERIDTKYDTPLGVTRRVKEAVQAAQRIEAIKRGQTHTRWDIKGDRERAALDRMRFAPGGEPGRCSGCGEELPTEGAFARHFVVVDIRHPSMDRCPNKTGR